jgi:hypothetical protein
LAEAVGGVDFVLFVLLQGMHGRLPASVAATFGLHGGAAGGRRRHRQGLRLQVAIQKSRVLLPSRVRVHLQQMDGRDRELHPQQKKEAADRERKLDRVFSRKMIRADRGF